MDRQNLELQLAPVARFAGHTFATVVGFLALALLSLLPVGLLHLLKLVGLEDTLADLELVKRIILYADIGMFALTFTFGAVEFVVTEYVLTRRRLTALMAERVTE